MRYVQNHAKLIALLGLINLIFLIKLEMQSQLVHDMHLDELTEFPDERLPQSIDLDGLLVLNCVCLIRMFVSFKWFVGKLLNLLTMLVVHGVS